MAANQVLTGIQQVGDGAVVTARADKQGALMATELNPRYYENTYRGKMFTATAIGISANVIYSTAAGTGGPLIWNPPGSGVNVVLLKVGFALTTGTSVAGMVGITSGVGQLLVPGSVTAIDAAVKNSLIGAGNLSQVNVYRIGTPTNAGTGFFGLFSIGTQAITAVTETLLFADLEGSFILPPGGWLSCSSGSATLTSAVSTCSAMWAELPI